MIRAHHQSLHQGRLNSRGNALVPILIIFVALLCSASVFFLFTRKKMQEKHAADDKAGVAANQTATPPPASPNTPATPTSSPAANAAPAPAPKPEPKPSKPVTFGFARPADLGEQLARSLSTDLPKAASLISAGDPKQQETALAVLEKLKALGYLAAAPEKVQVIGQSGPVTRLAIPLIKADGSSTEERLLLDITKDDKMGWKVSAIKLSKELAPALAAAPTSPAATPAPASPSADPSAPAEPKMIVPSTASLFSVEAEPDSLTFASDFVNVLLKPNYEAARKYIDEEKISTVKLAALCIVFEDGKYTLQSHRPLISTVTTDTTSWVIAKVQSKQSNIETEFGLELEKLNNGKWRVSGLNLSRILDDSAKASPDIGLPYTPLVHNPKGGESIALYFEYDSDILHPRAKRQLEIVAGILKSKPSSTLKITGHTDAKGTDQYNLYLSNKRAAAVKQALLDFGVPVAQVQTIGFGAAAPLAPNVNPDGTDNPDNRSKNRRAEIYLDF